MTQVISIGNQARTLAWLSNTAEGQHALAVAYSAEERPRCLCLGHGIEMYIGRRGDTYYLSRMPGSGILHAQECLSGERDTNLQSAMDVYSPLALQDAPGGITQVTFDTTPKPLVRPPFPSVSYAGLLDLLFHRSHLNTFLQAEDRTWGAVRERFTSAATSMTLVRPGHAPYPLQIFIPAPFDKTHASAQLAAANAALSTAAFVLAPCKEISRSTYGWGITLRHLPYHRFWLNEARGRELESRADGTLSLQQPPDRSLCLLHTHPGNRPLSYVVTGMAMLRVDRRYMPSLSDDEDAAADWLASRLYNISRPLRFDAPWHRFLASYVILGQHSAPHQLAFVASGSTSVQLDATRQSYLSLLSRNHVDVLTWCAGNWSSVPAAQHRPVQTP